MARTRWVPEPEERERRYGRDDEDFKSAGFEEAEIPIPQSEYWEFQSLGNFIDFLDEEQRDQFTTGELAQLAQSLRVPNRQLRLDLEALGLRLRPPAVERTFRTFGDNPHNRWLDDDAKRMSGGGGGSSILGMVG